MRASLSYLACHSLQATAWGGLEESHRRCPPKKRRSVSCLSFLAALRISPVLPAKELLRVLPVILSAAKNLRPT
jgi:hypothetical protein